MVRNTTAFLLNSMGLLLFKIITSAGTDSSTNISIIKRFKEKGTLSFD